MPEQLRYRLYDFEVTPPPAAWDTIDSRLQDDQQHALLVSKMYDYQQAPPTQAWNTIAADLDESSSASMDAPAGKHRTLLPRFAAAAVFFGLLLGTWYWMQPNKTTDQVVVKENKPISPAPPTLSTQIVVPFPKNDSQDQRQAAAFVELKKNNGNKNLSQRGQRMDEKMLKYAALSATPAYREYPITIHTDPVRDDVGAATREIDQLTTQGNYLAITAPNGQLTKISSKFAHVLRYLNNADGSEGYLDKVMNERSIWKKRFQDWRKKIVGSSFKPASANFLDIFELKELIEEK